MTRYLIFSARKFRNTIVRTLGKCHLSIRAFHLKSWSTGTLPRQKANCINWCEMSIWWCWKSWKYKYWKSTQVWTSSGCDQRQIQRSHCLTFHFRCRSSRYKDPGEPRTIECYIPQCLVQCQSHRSGEIQHQMVRTNMDCIQSWKKCPRPNKLQRPSTQSARDCH